MTLVRIAAVLLVAVAASGCFLDEIDKSVEANKFKAANVPAGASKPGEPPKPGATAAKPAAGAAGAPVKSWWETAKTLGSEESTADIVGCSRGGRLEFMERDDCLARGGSPQ
jgi:hypothetical protein